MDLIRLLRSLEEFLYELVGWLVFYPRTFWRILWHPGKMAMYTRRELMRDRELQFEATISPVLMLILSVVIAHAMEMALDLPLPKVDSPLGRLLFGSEQGVLLTRSAVFCIYALGAAVSTLRQDKRAIDRETLRTPFSIQAFLACPFLVMFSAGEQLARVHNLHAVGLSLELAAVLWYLLARMIAYRALYAASWPRAIAWVLISFTLTTLLIVILFLLLGIASG